MIRFLSGIAVAVATVVVLSRLLSPVPAVEKPTSITVVEPCQPGDRAVVEGVSCG